MRRWCICLAAFSVLFAACSKPNPQIEFVGMSTGTLTTDISQLKFRSVFETKHKELVGAVSLKNVRDGVHVQATWFSPDDRTMPLGRTTLVTQSGAKVARFSIASKDPWTPSPYMLLVEVLNDKGVVTSSGSTHFFIGMKDKEIQAYIQDYTNWQKEQALPPSNTGATINP